MCKLKEKPFFRSNKENGAYLYLNIKYSNIFITLCDKKKRVIICKTAGMTAVNNRRKPKVAPQAIENIVRSLKTYFEFYKIVCVRVILKVKPSAHLYILVKELTLMDINILSFTVSCRVPHNGMRGRKMKRK